MSITSGLDALRARFAPPEQPRRQQQLARPAARNPLGQRPDQQPAVVRRGQEVPQQVVNYQQGDRLIIDGMEFNVIGMDSKGRVNMLPVVRGQGTIVSKATSPEELRAKGIIPIRSQERQGQPAQVARRPEASGQVQRQQGEQRVPFADSFPVGVGASVDGQRLVSTGMKDDRGRLIFRQKGGDTIAIDPYMLQVKGAFPLPPEPESPAVEAVGKTYHVRPGQDVYVLRSSGEIERGWKVKHIDGTTGKVRVESVDGQGKSIHRDDPREFIDDLNRPTVPEDIRAIDFDRARTPLERRERIINVVRRLKDGGLAGSKGFSRSDQLATDLQALFDHPSQDGINLLTDTGGLREKVRELLNTELAEQGPRGNS